MALRDPDRTRANIIEVAACEFHQNGYKGTSLSDILTAAQISKGALYHHFTNKQDLLYAVFDEVFEKQFLQPWRDILTANDPVEAIACVIESMATESVESELCNGCPVHNVAAELAGTDENIRARVEGVYSKIQNIIAEAIEKGQQQKQVDPEVDCQQSALFFMCCLNGIPQMVKSCQEKKVFVQLTSALADYMRRLKVVS